MKLPCSPVVSVILAMAGLFQMAGAASFQITGVEPIAAVQGVSPPAMTAGFTVIAPGSTEAWAASLEGSPTWASLNATSGSGAGSVTVSFNTSTVGAGTYSTALALNSGGTISRQAFTLTVITPNVIKMEADLSRPVIYALHRGTEATNPPGFVIFLNTDTKRVELVLPAGTKPTDFDISYPEDRLYVCNHGTATGSIRAIDLTSRREVRSMNGDADIYKINAGRSGRLFTEGLDQWISIAIVDSTTGAVIRSSQNPDYFSVREGDGEVDPTGRFYYHCDNNNSDAKIRKFDVSADTWNQVKLSPERGYGTRNLVMSPDGSRLFWQTRVYDTELNELITLGAEVYACTFRGEIAFTDSRAYNAASGVQLATLPVTSTVMAVAGDQSSLFYFNASSKTFGSVALSSIAPVPVPGAVFQPPQGSVQLSPLARLSWDAAPAALKYRVFYGTNAASVAAATAASPEYAGETWVNFWMLPAGTPPPGESFYWRVDYVGLTATATGSVRSFQTLPVTVSPTAVDVRSVRSASPSVVRLQVMGPPGVTWTASSSGAPWLRVLTTSGSAGETLELELSAGSMAAGTYSATVTLSAGGLSAFLPVNFAIEAASYVALLADPVRPRLYALQRPASLTGAVVVIDSATSVIERVLPVSDNPSDFDLTPDNQFLYIVTRGGRKMHRLNLTDWSMQEQPLGTSSDSNSAGTRYRVAAGAGTKVYWVDGEWGPRLHTMDFATGAETGPPVMAGSTGSGFSAIAWTGDGSTLAGMTQSGWSGGSSQAQAIHIVGGGASAVTISLGATVQRGSLNVPVLPRADGSGVFMGNSRLAPDLSRVLTTYPADVYAVTKFPGFVFGAREAWRERTLTRVWQAPTNVNASICAVAGDQSAFFYFNAAAGSLVRVAMSTLGDLPGPAPEDAEVVSEMPPALSWTPNAQALRYEVYFGTDRAGVTDALGTASPFHLGTSEQATLPLTAPFQTGEVWWWRVDTVLPGLTVKGTVWRFTGAIDYVTRLAGVETGGSDVPVLVLEGTTLLAGYPNYRTITAATPGVVQVFRKRPGREEWYLHQKIDKPQSAGANAQFGSAIALKGDVAWIGARNDGTGGRAYEFVLDSLTDLWTPTGRALQSPSAVAGDQFGASLGFDGSFVAVGMPGARVSDRSSAGAVEVFSVDTLTRLHRITESSPVNFAYFGTVMAMDPGVLALGSPQRASTSGSVEIWTRGPTAWSRTATLTQNTAGFGSSLALEGNTLLASAKSGTGGTPGRIFVYERGAAGAWLLSSQFPVAGTPRADSYTPRLARQGEFLAVGTPTDSVSIGFPGTTWIYRDAGDAIWAPVAPAVTTGLPSSSLVYGGNVAVTERYLATTYNSSTSPAGVSIFLHNSSGNLAPRFSSTPEVFAEAGSPYHYMLVADDENAGDRLGFAPVAALPSWLSLTDHGNGTATLAGTAPAGFTGDVSIAIDVLDEADDFARQSFTLRVLSPGSIPEITAVTGDQVSDDGRRVEFSVIASGAVTYQWFHNGALLSGQTGPGMVIDNVQASDAGTYHVRVSRGGVWIDSDPMQLTVNQVADRFGGDWPTAGVTPARAGAYPASLSRHIFFPAWTVAGAGINQVATGRGAVFVSKGGGFSNDSALSAYSLQTGQRLWSTAIPAGFSVNPPTYHRGRVYVQRGKSTGNDSPDLRCFNAGTGTLQWTANFSAQWETYMAPAVDDTGIYVNGGTYGGMYRFGLDGSQVFYVGLEQRDHWAPMLYQQTLYSWVDGNFRGHDPGSGGEIFRISFAGNTGIWGGVPCAEGNIALMRGRELYAVDLTARRVLWQKPGVWTGSPAIRDGIAYAIREGAVESFDALTGAARMVYPTLTASNVSAVGVHQPVVLDDTLIVSSENNVWTFDLATGLLLQRLSGGGPLTYTDGVLLGAGDEGTLRAWKVNQPAIITPPAAELAAAEDVPLTWEIAVSDPDADPLSVSFSGLPAWLTAGPLEGGRVRLTGTPLYHHTGPLAFTLTASDNKTFPTEVTIRGSVMAVNDAPLAASIAPVTVEEDSPIPARSLLTVFSDEEDRFADLTIRVAGNTNPALFSRILFLGPNLLLTAAPDAHGSAVLTIEARDTGGLRVEAAYAITVNPVPDAPLPAANPPPLSIPADGSPFAYPGAALFTDPDPGEILTYSLLQVDRPELFQSLTVDAATGQLHADWKPHVWGTAIVTLRATGLDGLLLDAPLTLSLPEPSAPTWNLTGAASVNRQTGLVEQRITLTNTAARAIAGFELWVSTGSGTALYNGIRASSQPGGSTPPAPWLLPWSRPLAAGETVSLILEFYNPMRAAEFTIAAAGALDPLSSASPPPSAQGAAFAITRALPVSDGMLVEFPSEPGADYHIEYSGDNQTWSVCPLPLKAGGTRVQWIDRGPPFTLSAPETVTQRFYRVRRM